MGPLSDWLDAWQDDADTAWAHFDREWAWVRRLAECPQDPVHHAEGNVWIHTRMVLEELVRSEAFASLDRRGQEVCFAACLLHDIAKPWTTRQEGGRVTARGHSAAGAVAARGWLYEQGVHPSDREAICAIVLRHQLPFFAVEDDDGERRTALASWGSPSRWLAAVNEADGRGRVCDDPVRIQDNVDLFRVMADELGCLDQPYPFANPTARFRCARREGTRHDVPPEHFDGTCFVMSGLPGAGKDHWIRTHQPDLPMVSLDALRAELGVDPREPQGPVAAAAREQARVHLRKGQDFVWNATNVTRQHRQRIVDLAVDYRFRVVLVQVEAPLRRLVEQNRRRPDRVPDGVITALIRKWQFAEPTEAHEVLLATGADAD